MQPVTAPGRPADHGASHGAYRWAWAACGLVAVAALAIPGTYLLTTWRTTGPWARQVSVTVRTVTVTQPVTSLDVNSYGGQVRVTAGPVSQVQVTERITYDPSAGGGPAAAESVSGGRLSLSDPACANVDCNVDFTVTVPSAVSVSVDTQGGPAFISAVSGAAGTTVSSDGGLVQITQVSGPLTVSSGGGPVTMNNVTGPLHADTGGGVLIARGVTAATASISTGGGAAVVAFTAAPDAVTLNTDGGPATLRVPGGPYAVSADSEGGPEIIGIATDPAARATLKVMSGGGPILLGPATGTGTASEPG